MLSDAAESERLLQPATRNAMPKASVASLFAFIADPGSGRSSRRKALAEQGLAAACLAMLKLGPPERSNPMNASELQEAPAHESHPPGDRNGGGGIDEG